MFQKHSYTYTITDVLLLAARLIFTS